MKIEVHDPQLLKQVCERVLRMRPPRNIKQMLEDFLRQIEDAK